MKKKSIAARLGVAALALTLVTASLSSGTLAKYTETFKAEAAFEIAKWKVSANITKEGDATWTAMNATPVTGNQLAATAYAASQNHVADNKIAPGMSGEFTINVSAAKDGTNSDVDVKYQIYIDKTGTAPTNLTMTNENDGTQLTLTGTKSNDLGYLLGEGVLAKSSNKTEKVKVTWEWLYGETDTSHDKTDTLNGSSGGNGTYSFAVVFTQIAPTDDTTSVPTT